VVGQFPRGSSQSQRGSLCGAVVSESASAAIGQLRRYIDD
jgi:hypothetical protein